MYYCQYGPWYMFSTMDDIVIFVASAFGGRPGRDCMVVGFTTTYASSVYHH